MSDGGRPAPSDAPLNPALKSGIERSIDTEHTTPAPFETASAKEGQGEGWPLVWLVVVILCIAITIYLLL